MAYFKERELPYLLDEFGSKWPMARYYKERIHDPEVRERMGKEALQNLEYRPLDSTAMFKINNDNHYKTLNLSRNDKV